MLLCAQMVALLARIAGVDDVQALAASQFKAKSKQLADFSAHQLANGDCKEFTISGGDKQLKIGFSVIETTDDGVILDRVNELYEEIPYLRAENGMDVLFLAVVNIVDLKSKLVCAGPVEQSLAAAAFSGALLPGSDGKLMDLGERVSRKKEFVPPLQTAIGENGWQMPENYVPETLEPTELFVDELDPHARVQRRKLQ